MDTIRKCRNCGKKIHLFVGHWIHTETMIYSCKQGAVGGLRATPENNMYDVVSFTPDEMLEILYDAVCKKYKEIGEPTPKYIASVEFRTIDNKLMTPYNFDNFNMLVRK